MKLFLLSLFGVACAHANNATNVNMANQGKNIVELAQSVPDLSTLVTALTAGKLTTALSGAGPFTVFAPTNEAFGKLPAATLANLLKPENIKQLDAVLEYHVIAGAAVYAKDLKVFQEVKTLEGDDLKIVKAGRVVVGNAGATVTKADNAASNGVVHIINGVLIPPSPPGPAPGPAPGPNHLWFSGISTDVDRCGDVDAAPRMPDSLFLPENAAALKRYEDLTIKLYNPITPPFPSDVGNLTLGRCTERGYNKKAGGEQGVTWANTALMNPICEEQCKCAFDPPPPYTLPRCKDQPDDPKAKKWCSLCGPKYNGVLTINLWVR